MEKGSKQERSEGEGVGNGGKGHTPKTLFLMSTMMSMTFYHYFYHYCYYCY